MKADNEKVTRLIKTARGQMDGILKMIEDDRYCIDISTQLMATEAIMRRANREILKAHMLCCVREAFEEGNEDEKLNEILDLVDKLSK